MKDILSTMNVDYPLEDFVNQRDMEVDGKATDVTNENTSELADNLAKAVEIFDKETSELHDKIIDADMKMLEYGMELESLELANREMDEQIKYFSERLKKKASSSVQKQKVDPQNPQKVLLLEKQQSKLMKRIRRLEEKEATLRDPLLHRIFYKCMVDKGFGCKHHVHRSKRRRKSKTDAPIDFVNMNDKNNNLYYPETILNAISLGCFVKKPEFTKMDKSKIDAQILCKISEESLYNKFRSCKSYDIRKIMKKNNLIQGSQCITTKGIFRKKYAV